ncbi:MAG: metallophosphoesterase family protein [Paludibacteraceae bacterium]|nr:metallophosphoesterase family protein [Paludibacteraceae bacterium]
MKKRILWIVSILLILSGGITLCVVRWDAWFTNPAEPIYDVPAEPMNIVLTFGQDAASQRVVSWRAGQDTTALSFLLLTDLQSGETDTLAAQSALVASRSGEAVFHQVHLDSLHAGEYAYQVHTADKSSESFIFRVQDYKSCERDTFLLFGDLQYTSEDEGRLFFDLAYQTLPEADFVAYIGDIIERPTDDYWQLFFHTTDGRTATLPQVAALGNHEYLKGVYKQFDVRWPYIFVNPQNGPARFLGRTYFVDFPFLRLIVLDTDALQRPSDFIVLRTWLTQVLNYESVVMNQTDDENDRWNVVLMHHPIYSAGMGRDNFFVAWALRYALLDADLVVAGHDHNYARHRFLHESTPVYVITSSSAKSYLPKCSRIEERLGCNHAFFSAVSVSQDTMSMTTYLVDSLTTPLPYDELLFVRNDDGVLVTESDSLPEERLELPARYEGRNNVHTRRFINRRNARFEQQD